MFLLNMNNGFLKFVVPRYDTGYQYNKSTAFTHPQLTDGKWHHIALVSDFNSITYATITTTLYVDGQAVDVVTEVKLSSSVTLNGTNMAVDNLRVYDTRKLSAQEFKAIYSAKE